MNRAPISPVSCEPCRIGKWVIADPVWIGRPRALTLGAVFFRQFLNDTTACASYLLGCKSCEKFAVVDPHLDLVDEYLAAAAEQGVTISAVFETHLQADHLSGLAALVEQTGATAYLPPDSGVEVPHHSLQDGETVKLGNTEIRAISAPGHAPSHHVYVVVDRRRGEDPWLALTGDALLIGDVGRPDLHAHGEVSAEAMARSMYRSLTEKVLALPDHVLVFPAHYSGSVCGRGLSATPVSTIGFERRHNPALQADSEDDFAAALLEEVPAPPPGQEEILAANRAGRPLAEAR